MGPAGCDALHYDQAIQDALQVSSLQAVDMNMAREGLHSPDLHSHLPSLL